MGARRETYWDEVAREVRAGANQLAQSWRGEGAGPLLVVDGLEDLPCAARLERLQALEESGALRLALLVRDRTLRPAWLEPLLPAPLRATLDATVLLRAVHRETGFALRQRAECRRRGYSLLVLLLERR